MQRNLVQEERRWHFGRAYVCNKGGCEHEHLSRNDWLRCKEEDIRTKQKREHTQLLKDKDLQIAAQKTKRVAIKESEETKRLKMQHAHEIEMKRLEIEGSANMEGSNVEEVMNSFCDLLINFKQSTNHGST